MAKALNITVGKPMSVEQADKQHANPKHVEKFILDPKGAYVDKGGTALQKKP